MLTQRLVVAAVGLPLLALLLWLPERLFASILIALLAYGAFEFVHAVAPDAPWSWGLSAGAFTALLVVFFAVVAVIHEQHLFSPVIHWVMTFEGKTQEALFYIANGVLSMISDNVFVATVYIGEVASMFEAGTITREQFDALAVAINTGTNIPSVATPNGQAAFLFLLTSALAPLIRLSYGRMVIMALPYTLTMSVTGLLALWFLG